VLSLNQLHRQPLNLVVNVDLALRGRNRAMPREAREHPRGYLFVRDLRDERAPPRVTAQVLDARPLTIHQKSLGAGVRREPARRVVPVRKQRAPRIAGRMSQPVTVTMQLGTKFLCVLG
jgi:hypothetical protein